MIGPSSDKGGVSHHTPPSEECVDGDPRKPKGLWWHPDSPAKPRGRFDIHDGQLDFGFGRIRPNVKDCGWLLFDGQSQTWQGLTLGAVPTGRYTHVEPCLAALKRLRAIEADMGPAPIRRKE